MLFGGPKKGAKKIDLSKNPTKAKARTFGKVGTSGSKTVEVKKKEYKLRKQALASIRKRQKEASASIRRREAGLPDPYGHDKIFKRSSSTDDSYIQEQLKSARETAKEGRENRNKATKALIAKHQKNRRYKPKYYNPAHTAAEKKSILKSVDRYTGEYHFGRVPKMEHLKEWIEKILQYEDKLTKSESVHVAKCLKMVARKWKMSHADIYKLESIYARRTP